MITINLSNIEERVISASLGEYYGGSSLTLRDISGYSIEEVESTLKHWNEEYKENHNTATLTNKDWKLIYDSVNAVIYALGPSELETCTGLVPLKFLQTNLNIASKLWGAYGGAKWEDYYSSDSFCSAAPQASPRFQTR